MGRVSSRRLGRGRFKPPAVHVPPPPPSGDEGPHDFFEEAVESEYHFTSRHLRSQADIEAVHHGINGLPVHTHTNYLFGDDDFRDPNDDTEIDAAKIVMPAGVTNYEQLRIPVNFSADHLGVATASLLWVWDVYFDQSYIDEVTPYFGYPDTYKAFQFSSANPATETDDKITFEPKTTFIGWSGKAGWAHVRVYGSTFEAPATKGGAGANLNGRNYGSDSLAPMSADFGIDPNIWTRFYARFDFSAETSIVKHWFWVADENRDPVLIYEDLGYGWGVGGRIHKFWLEWNSSDSRTGGGEWIAFVRNIVGLRDVPDVNYWLRRPVRNQ